MLGAAAALSAAMVVYQSWESHPLYLFGQQRNVVNARRKVRFFRPPNARDVQALQDAEARLRERWAG